MPTISEIIAQRNAAKNKADTSQNDVEEAIARISSPGKPRALVLKKTDQCNPKLPKDSIERSLSSKIGESIPITPMLADQETATWHQALNAYESELCLIQDQEVAWLAVKPIRKELQPILICRLPWLLWPHQSKTSDPF